MTSVTHRQQSCLWELTRTQEFIHNAQGKDNVLRTEELEWLYSLTVQDTSTEVDKKRTRLTFEPFTQLGGGVSGLNVAIN